MGIFDKVRLPEAVGRKNKFAFSCSTMATQEFFSLRPVFSREIMPSCDVRVTQSYFARVAPLHKPMLGNCRIVNRAFFVPYRTIMPAFDDMMQDRSTSYNGALVRYSAVPHCKQSVIVASMLNSSCTVVGSSTDYDFTAYFNGNLVYYKFNETGKNIYAILCGLGYSLCFEIVAGANDPDDVDVSLMPLLAYFKIVADWYVSNNNSNRGESILNVIRTIGESQTVTAGQLTNLLMLCCYSTLDNDYFTTASKQPVVAPSDSAVQIDDVTNDATGSTTRDYVRSTPSPNQYLPSTPSIASNSGDSVARNITQYALNALKALTDYAQRNNLVGAKTLDRFRARFGFNLDAAKLDRSLYLGSNSSNVNVSEVISNADTSGAALGEFAGRGIMRDQGNGFSYHNQDDFGIFIILSTVLPRVMYGQGIKRENLHINRLDFFTPEFDALGMQAIARAELYYDAKTQAATADLRQFAPNEAFGFQPMYCEYCKGDDILAGDFRRRQFADLRPYHFFRLFNDDNISGSPAPSSYKTVSESFMVGNPSEYNQIFNYGSNDTDHFFVAHQFDVVLVQPKKRMFDSYDMHMDGGDYTDMSLKGTKLN